MTAVRVSDDRALVWSVVNGLTVKAYTSVETVEHVEARAVWTRRWRGGELIDKRTGAVLAQELRIHPGVDPW